VREAREILREYRDRKRSDAGAHAPEALREENLRRLLRHVGAAHPPPEPFEDRLLRAMLRTGEERAARRGRRGWIQLSRPVWQVWAPAAAALVVSALVFAAQLSHSSHPTAMARLQIRPQPPSPPFPSPRLTPKQPPLIGRVLTGDLLRRHPGEERAEPGGSDAEIHLGDEVSTDANMEASVVFLDYSVCWLLPNSTLRYTSAVRTGLKRPSLLLLTRGETWNTVEKGGPPFMVRTPSATAVVHGTEFGVAVDAKGKTTLRVTAGKVELQAAHTSVFVRAGMQSVALPGQAPQPPVSLLPAPKPPSQGQPRPGPLPVAPPGGGKRAGAAPDQHGKTFQRSLPPAAQPPASTDGSPPTAPFDSSGAPNSSRGDHPDEPRMPISTSRP